MEETLQKEQVQAQTEFPEIMTVEQTARFLQCGKNKVYEMSHWRGFPAFKLRGSIRIPKQALLEWIQQQVQQRDEADMPKVVPVRKKCKRGDERDGE